MTPHTGLTGRDFLAERDFSADELRHLIELSARLKSERSRGDEEQHLRGKGVALIFEKPSTRTRIAFEAAVAHQGGFTTFLDPASSQIGHKESIADTARVLSRVFDGIQFRGAQHSTIEELAHYASVPVYNGLTDDWHPTQMLADFLTMYEHSGTTNPRFAYLGDARNNMGNSLLVTGAILGADVRIIAPRELWPSGEVQELARQRAEISGATITVTDDVDAVTGVEFVHTDVWVSMGESSDTWTKRIGVLHPYRVDEALMKRAGPSAKFMHCLPALHDASSELGRTLNLTAPFDVGDGMEVSSAVFDSAASIVFDQAENRLHTIKAVLVATLT